MGVSHHAPTCAPLPVFQCPPPLSLVTPLPKKRKGKKNKKEKPSAFWAVHISTGAWSNSFLRLRPCQELPAAESRTSASTSPFFVSFSFVASSLGCHLFGWSGVGVVTDAFTFLFLSCVSAVIYNFARGASLPFTGGRVRVRPWASTWFWQQQRPCTSIGLQHLQALRITAPR